MSETVRHDVGCFDIYSLFDISPTFFIDNALLEERYLALQTRYHPDRFVKSSVQEKAQATEKTMEINAAYRLLKNPLSRAHYLLQSANFDTAAPVSPALLLEMMDMREQWAEVCTQPDHAHFLQKLDVDIQETSKIFAHYIAQKDVKSIHTYHQLSFLSKLREETLTL